MFTIRASDKLGQNHEITIKKHNINAVQYNMLYLKLKKNGKDIYCRYKSKNVLLK